MNPGWWVVAALAVGPDEAARADAHARHQALYLEARDAETARRYPDAVAACDAAIAALPDGPRAETCRSRLDWLAARRDADGAWASLAELQAVRAGFRELDPEVAAERVRALRAREGVAELVWVDAGLWLARRALDRGDPAAALALTEPIVSTHHGELRKPAVGVHAIALLGVGREADASAAEEEIRVAERGLRDTPVEALLRARRERDLAKAGGAAIGAFAVVTVPLAWRGRAAEGRPWGLVPIVVAGLGAWAIGEGWSDGAGAAAPWMTVGFAVVYLVAGPAQHAVADRWRPAVRALAGLATVGVAVVSLYATNTLDWVTP